jgi:hypothetical protein
MSVPILPETRVGALLEAYPALEEVLIAMAPAFAKLRNPVLRRTVAKVATLEQAAKIGGISVRDLVVRLREAAGQPLRTIEACTREADSFAVTEPAAKAAVTTTIDADALLENGVHPLGQVRRAAGELRAREALCVVSSFRPQPLIEALDAAAYKVDCRLVRPGRYETHIIRA